MTRRIAALSMLALALIAVPAMAKQGKVGLWNVTSSTDVTLPPQVAAALKKAGQSLPAARPMTVQMCMSQAEVDSSEPPHLDSKATGCVTKTTRQTASEMTATMTCNGDMKGSGSIQISYSGNEHYAGSYSFKGTSFGSPANITTRFKGDWVKADCGSVKPYSLRTQ
jgi:hypothetical protein